MYHNRIRIISHNENNFGPIQKLLLENGLEVKTVKSIEDMFDEFLKTPHALTIIDGGSYGEDTLMMVNYLHGAKSAPILVLLSETVSIDRLELFRKGATVCMAADVSPQAQAAQAMALVRIYGTMDDDKRRKALAFGTSLVINPAYRMVVLNGKIVKLTRREFDLLYFSPKLKEESHEPQHSDHRTAGRFTGFFLGGTAL